MKAWAIKVNNKILPAWVHGHRGFLIGGRNRFKADGHKAVIVRVEINEAKKD